MERLHKMKECLIDCVQYEMKHIEQVDTKELGEAIDMIKDLEEAIYYATITEAMHGDDYKARYPKWKEDYGKEMHQEHRKYYDKMEPPWPEDDMYYMEGAYNQVRDMREGTSPIHRKMYMESKELHHDKAKQMQELENYLHELSKDVTEMIRDATPEEKQMLQQKLSALATKIK